MIKDPRTKELCENGDTFNGWIGPDVHFLFSTIKNGSDCCWVLTHRDEHDIDKSWSFPGKVEKVKELLRDWDPICTAIVEKTPSLVDWKLVYRDPLPRWISDKGRIALLGLCAPVPAHECVGRHAGDGGRRQHRRVPATGGQGQHTRGAVNVPGHSVRARQGGAETTLKEQHAAAPPVSVATWQPRMGNRPIHGGPGAKAIFFHTEELARTKRRI